MSKPWTKEEVERLLHIVNVHKVSRAKVAEMLGRSRTSVNVKLCVLRGGRRDKNKRSINARGQAPYKVPRPRENDCYLHLSLISGANGGLGFPTCDLPARFRVAA